jgi:hypothetical protein
VSAVRPGLVGDDALTINPLRTREPVIVPDRPALTKPQKVAIWNRENGICWYCLKPVAQDGQGVTYDHKTPRALNGSDDPEGIFPIHTRPCNELKTNGKTGDIARVAKAKRQEKLTRPKERKRSGFRQHPTLKRTIDGRVVPR